MNSLNSVSRFKVKFRDCDPLQIVWHGNYIKYFEDAREDFCRVHGFSYQDMRDRGYATPIVRSLCEHKLPLRYGDEFEVIVTFVPTPAAKMVFKYRITSNNKLIATGETVQVFLDKNGELVLTNLPFFAEWKNKMGIKE
jgi:acyl-CoA thioester hydrolase